MFELEALKKSVLENFNLYVKLYKKIPEDVSKIVNQITDYSKFTDTISSYFTLKLTQKQELLETFNVKERLEKLLKFIDIELNILQIQQQIRTRVRDQIEKSQRDYYLQEQLKAIYKELNNNDGDLDESMELEKKDQRKNQIRRCPKKSFVGGQKIAHDELHLRRGCCCSQLFRLAYKPAVGYSRNIKNRFEKSRTDFEFESLWT